MNYFVPLHENITYMKNFLIFISMVLLFAACSKHEEDDKPLSEGRRTVILYVSGDNILSSFTSTDIQELINGAKNNLSSSDRLVMFVDRISDIEKPFIARITGNEQQPVDTLYKYPTDFLVSEPSNFREVLTRIQGLCPAKEYGLVLWGHGTGWTIETSVVPAAAPRRAYGVDNGNVASRGDHGLWLNIPDMRKVFEQMGVKWKFIFADCCNMMCAEVAYELRNCVDYLIGSPAEIPGQGAPYHKIVTHLFSQSDNFYEGIVDAYANDNLKYLPLSVIQLSEMEQLAKATKQVMPQIAAHLRLGDEAATRGIIYYCAPGGMYDDVNKVMYDMNHMILRALAEQPEAYTQWHQALERAVVKRVTSMAWATNNSNTVNFSDFREATETEQGCVSMFFPLNKYDNSTCSHFYNQDIRQMQWYQAVDWASQGY